MRDEAQEQIGLTKLIQKELDFYNSLEKTGDNASKVTVNFLKKAQPLFKHFKTLIIPDKKVDTLQIF